LNALNEKIATEFVESDFKKPETVKFDPAHFHIYLHFANKSDYQYENSLKLRKLLGLKRNDAHELIFQFKGRQFERNFQYYLFRHYPDVNWEEVKKVIRLTQNIQDILFINKE